MDESGNTSTKLLCEYMTNGHEQSYSLKNECFPGGVLVDIQPMSLRSGMSLRDLYVVRLIVDYHIQFGPGIKAWLVTAPYKT